MFTGEKNMDFCRSLGMAAIAMREGKTNDEIVKILEERGHSDEDIIDILGILTKNMEETTLKR